MVMEAGYSLKDGCWIDGTPYRVVRGLGQGGMGEVYEVDHTRAGTRRALKVLRACADPGGQAALRLQREGRALAHIDHANVVRVFELGRIHDGRPYFAMQLLEGGTARELLTRSGRMDVRRAVRVVLQALSGLAAVHARGVIHRDVKPSNLFVCRNDAVKLLDFGIAKIVYGAGAGPATAEGIVLGTMRYMAPEQVGGRRVGPATDVYAMALVLFELITCEHGFQRRSGSDSVMSRLHARPPRLSEVLSGIPASLDDVISWALEPDPADRPQTAEGFARALADAIGVRKTETATRVMGAIQPALLEPPTVVEPGARRRTVAQVPPSGPPDWRAAATVGLAASVCSLAIGATVAAAAARMWPPERKADDLRASTAACRVAAPR